MKKKRKVRKMSAESVVGMMGYESVSATACGVKLVWMAIGRDEL